MYEKGLFSVPFIRNPMHLIVGVYVVTESTHSCLIVKWRVWARVECKYLIYTVRTDDRHQRWWRYILNFSYIYLNLGWLASQLIQIFFAIQIWIKIFSDLPCIPMWPSLTIHNPFLPHHTEFTSFLLHSCTYGSEKRKWQKSLFLFMAQEFVVRDRCTCMPAQYSISKAGKIV